LRALNWRYNFKFLPSIVAVLSEETLDDKRTRRKYVLPPLPSTIIKSGDRILFLPPSDIQSPSQMQPVKVLSKEAMNCLNTKLGNKAYINKTLHRYDNESETTSCIDTTMPSAA